MGVEVESELAAREQRIYSELPVPKAVAGMVIPTIISQIITVIYNLADTWYVGLTGNAATVAAISLCLPVYNIMTAFANLFGIGGASVVTRAVGGEHPHRAQRAFAIAIWGGADRSGSLLTAPGRVRKALPAVSAPQGLTGYCIVLCHSEAVGERIHPVGIAGHGGCGAADRSDPGGEAVPRSRS